MGRNRVVRSMTSPSGVILLGYYVHEILGIQRYTFFSFLFHDIDCGYLLEPALSKNIKNIIFPR